MKETQIDKIEIDDDHVTFSRKGCEPQRHFPTEESWVRLDTAINRLLAPSIRLTVYRGEIVLERHAVQAA